MDGPPLTLMDEIMIRDGVHWNIICNILFLYTSIYHIFILFVELFQKAPDESSQRDYLFFLAVGYTRIKVSTGNTKIQIKSFHKTDISVSMLVPSILGNGKQLLNKDISDQLMHYCEYWYIWEYVLRCSQTILCSGFKFGNLHAWKYTQAISKSKEEGIIQQNHSHKGCTKNGKKMKQLCQGYNVTLICSQICDLNFRIW